MCVWGGGGRGGGSGKCGKVRESGGRRRGSAWKNLLFHIRHDSSNKYQYGSTSLAEIKFENPQFIKEKKRKETNN